MKRGSRATGKPEFYFVQRKHFGFIQTLVCKSTPMSKQLEFVCRHVLGANQIVFTVITCNYVILKLIPSKVQSNTYLGSLFPAGPLQPKKYYYKFVVTRRLVYTCGRRRAQFGNGWELRQPMDSATKGTNLGDTRREARVKNTRRQVKRTSRKTASR